LDIDYLIEKGFIYISDKENLGPTNQNKDHFDFDIADNLTKKLGLLLLQGWSSQSEERKINFNKWVSRHSWVEDFALFVVIREDFNMLPWWEWPQEFKIKNNKFLKSWIKKKNEEILIKKLIQWHLDEQWNVIKNFAKSRNIKLIGDLPFYVSRDSADVWSNKSLFSIYKNKSLFNYEKKVLIKELILNIKLGYFDFEKEKPQKVKFSLEANYKDKKPTNDKDLKSIVNYDKLVRLIKKLVRNKHYNFLETLAEDIFDELFKDKRIDKIVLKIEKLEIIKDCSSVGIQISKKRSNAYFRNRKRSNKKTTSTNT